MGESESWAARYFRITWRTFWYVAGINVLPFIMAGPMFGARFSTGFWFVLILPYSIAGSLSPLLRMSFSSRLICQMVLAFACASIALFAITDTGASDPVTAMVIIGFAMFGLPIIDASYSVLYTFSFWRERTGKGLDAFFETDPDDWTPKS